MLEKIGLGDIENNLRNSLIELDHNFLKKMLVGASGNCEPYRKKSFVDRLDLSFNKNVQKSIGLYALFRKNRAISFRTFIKLKNLVDYNWLEIEKNIISFRMGRYGGKTSINFPIKINKELGSIVGHIFGDGSISSLYHQMFYTNSDKDLIIEFYTCMKNIFDVEPRIWLQSPGRFKKQSRWVRRIKTLDEIEEGYQIALFYPSICSCVLFSILGSFAIGPNKKITRNMMSAPKEFKIGLIKAFFDDESTPSKTRNSIRVFQDNKFLLDSIKNILLDLGIESRPIRVYFKREKPRHYFDISYRESFLKFNDLISFSSKTKKDILSFRSTIIPQRIRRIYKD